MTISSSIECRPLVDSITNCTVNGAVFSSPAQSLLHKTLPHMNELWIFVCPNVRALCRVEHVHIKPHTDTGTFRSVKVRIASRESRVDPDPDVEWALAPLIDMNTASAPQTTDRTSPWPWRVRFGQPEM